MPLYYGRDGSGLAREWIAKSKRSMATVLPAFNTRRMLADYVTGKVWGYRGGQLTAPQSFAGVTGFGLDDGREMYAVTYDGGLDRVSFAA